MHEGAKRRRRFNRQKKWKDSNSEYISLEQVGKLSERFIGKLLTCTDALLNRGAQTIYIP